MVTPWICRRSLHFLHHAECSFRDSFPGPPHRACGCAGRRNSTPATRGVDRTVGSSPAVTCCRRWDHHVAPSRIGNRLVTSSCSITVTVTESFVFTENLDLGRAGLRRARRNSLGRRGFKQLLDPGQALGRCQPVFLALKTPAGPKHHPATSSPIAGRGARIGTPCRGDPRRDRDLARNPGFQPGRSKGPSPLRPASSPSNQALWADRKTNGFGPCRYQRCGCHLARSTIMRRTGSPSNQDQQFEQWPRFLAKDSGRGHHIATFDGNTVLHLQLSVGWNHGWRQKEGVAAKTSRVSKMTSLQFARFVWHACRGTASTSTVIWRSGCQRCRGSAGCAAVQCPHRLYQLHHLCR